MDERTLNIKLIPIKEDHLEIVRNWRNMPEVSEHMFNEVIISEVMQIEWFNRIKSDLTQMHFLIEYKKELVGLVSLHDINKGFSKCSWGFYIGDLKYRGEGVGSKALYLLMHKVFDDLQLNRIQSEVFSNNIASIRTHENLGFRREGFFREYVWKKDLSYDVVSLGMLKKEWYLLKDSLYDKIFGSPG